VDEIKYSSLRAMCQLGLQEYIQSCPAMVDRLIVTDSTFT
jgi:hypothetical protein